MNALLPDEAVHVSDKIRFVTAADMMKMDMSGEVILHNTMRFDVHLAHIQPMLDSGDVKKDELVVAIRGAIIDAVERVVGAGLDGLPIPGGAMIGPVARSAMLHRETISFDLS